MTIPTPQQTAAMDQFYAATTQALDKVIAGSRAEYAKLDGLPDSQLVAALAVNQREQVKANPDGVAAMLAVAVVRLVKGQPTP